MNLFKVLFLFLLFHQSASAQVTDTSKIDDNPKLTKEESAWLNKNIKTENFNFDNKCIGFFELNSGGFYGIGKFTMSLKKKSKQWATMRCWWWPVKR